MIGIIAIYIRKLGLYNSFKIHISWLHKHVLQSRVRDIVVIVAVITRGSRMYDIVRYGVTWSPTHLWLVVCSHCHVRLLAVYSPQGLLVIPTPNHLLILVVVDGVFIFFVLFTNFKPFFHINILTAFTGKIFSMSDLCYIKK